MFIPSCITNKGVKKESMKVTSSDFLDEQNNIATDHQINRRQSTSDGQGNESTNRWTDRRMTKKQTDGWTYDGKTDNARKDGRMVLSFSPFVSHIQ